MIPTMGRQNGTDRTAEVIKAEDSIRKLQLKIGKQKREEQRLKKEILMVYGSDDLALEK